MSEPSDLEFWTIRASAIAYDETLDDGNRRDFLAWLAAEKAKWQAEERERIRVALFGNAETLGMFAMERPDDDGSEFQDGRQSAWDLAESMTAHEIEKGSDDER